MSKVRGGGKGKTRRSGTARWRSGARPKRQPMLLLVGGALGAGVVGFRMLRRKTDGAAREMSVQEQTSGSPVDKESSAAAPSEERVTANERSDGVRRTGDDRLVYPMAAGERDPAAAADPTVAPASGSGQPTGVESPRSDA